MRILVIVLFVIALSSVAQAADKKPSGPSCQDVLNETMVREHNVISDRTVKEQALAKAQVTIYTLQNQLDLMKKQLADLKKSAEPKAESKADGKE